MKETNIFFVGKLVYHYSIIKMELTVKLENEKKHTKNNSINNK